MADSVRGYLFPSEVRLDLAGRIALGGMAGTGLAALSLAVFVLVLEAKTTASSQAWSGATIVSACAMGLHLLMESRATGPLNPWRWLVFAGCIAEVAIAPWFVIRDPAANLFFSAVGAFGGINLLGARLLSAWTREHAQWHPAWRILLAAAAWLVPCGAATALLVAKHAADRASFGRHDIDT